MQEIVMQKEIWKVQIDVFVTKMLKMNCINMVLFGLYTYYACLYGTQF